MTRLEDELKELKNSLSDIAHLVGNQLRKSITALLEDDIDLANEVIYNEKRVNALELKIDQDCEYILTLLNPMAQDMRLVISTLKINADMERIGDYAEGIAELVVIGKKNYDKSLIEDIRLNEMSHTALKMLDDIIKGYCEEDTKIARSVFMKDQELNEINRNASGIAEDFVRQNLDKIQQAFLTISIIRKLERVGDHITNIAEEIIFFKEAEVLRHKSLVERK